mmetsp:Transcript_11365/g.28854  ORF Transcript_11365/g.28854 Transcript_11365/m.28854 type:complete len:101 (-) Transcript_11365:1930-2232(-)
MLLALLHQGGRSLRQTARAALAARVAQRPFASSPSSSSSSDEQPPKEEAPQKQRPKVDEKSASNDEKDDSSQKKKEVDGPRGPEPTRYGDWERAGRCSDF